MRQKTAALIFLPLVAACFFGISPVWPQTDSDQDDSDMSWADRGEPQVEIFLSSLFANSTRDGSLGLRGTYPLKRRFALEGSLARIADGRVDIFLVDVSAKYVLKEGRRTDFYAVAGPGMFFSDDLDADELMLHLGFGWEIDLTENLYLRPELRGRWFADNIDAVNIADLSLGLGWRF